MPVGVLDDSDVVVRPVDNAPEIVSDVAVRPMDIALEIDSDVAVSPVDIAPEIDSHPLFVLWSLPERSMTRNSWSR